MGVLERAIIIAAEAHADKKNKAGAPDTCIVGSNKFVIEPQCVLLS